MAKLGKDEKKGEFRLLAIINSCAVFGMRGYGLAVEVDVGSGLPAFDIVGLPDAAVRESRERVRSALINSKNLLKRAFRQQMYYNLALIAKLVCNTS